VKKYKLWVHIEEIDEDADTCEDIGEPRSLGEYSTLTKAKNLREFIMEIGRNYSEPIVDVVGKKETDSHCCIDTENGSSDRWGNTPSTAHDLTNIDPGFFKTET